MVIIAKFVENIKQAKNFRGKAMRLISVNPKGYAAHICKSCASLPPEKRSEQMTINRIINLPWRLSKEQLSWLKNRAKDKRPKVRELAQEQLEMRFPSRQEQEDFEDDSEFLLDEDDINIISQ